MIADLRQSSSIRCHFFWHFAQSLQNHRLLKATCNLTTPHPLYKLRQNPKLIRSLRLL